MICKFCLKYCWQRYSDIWVWEMRLIMLIGNRWTHKLFYNALHIELHVLFHDRAGSAIHQVWSMTGPGRLYTRSGPWLGRVGYPPSHNIKWTVSQPGKCCLRFWHCASKIVFVFFEKKEFVSKGLYAHFPICF